ncbi:MAG: TetR/AcrR family transcriptional regulator [Phycisphaeraceae bacterium]|nr:TetR/AcrR family transcriptional regulator [Phycisphaeraceae bacterium]
MAKRTTSGRVNQRLRTRKELLSAAARLVREGRTPSMDDVAEAAMVSRATAYRYFPSVEALLVEAPLDGAVPDADAVLGGKEALGPAERVDLAEASLHEMCVRNGAQLRLMLAASLERTARGEHGGVPVRQNRRTRLIEAALAPHRRRIGRERYGRLCAALALVFGVESMVVFEDVLGINDARAREIKRWMIDVLVRSSMEGSRR